MQKPEENNAAELNLKTEISATFEPAATSVSNQYGQRFSSIERRLRSHSVFQVDEEIYHPTTPRPSHWSIAWSDLMMTMFILFLSMFVYQMAHEDFLGRKEPEIIGGDTTEALQTLGTNKATLPFPPIAPGVPLMTSGTIKKVEPVHVPPQEPESVYQAASPSTEPNTSKTQPEKDKIPEPITPPQEKIAVLLPAESPPVISLQADSVKPGKEEVLNPRPLIPETTSAVIAPAGPVQGSEDTFQEIYDLGKDALDTNKLNSFASIDLVPDKTMRIILTSDLLFALGESTLSDSAKESILKIGAAIRYTPYMINVVGHTDNVPMRSNRFASNWELSVARATTVARFLIDELGMNPNQFVVSGFSSYRPLLPNTTAENRAKNRRVELIISKRLPQPEQATAENLN